MAASKEGCIRERGRGAWQIIWEMPRGADGKRQARSETVHGTRQDARKRLAEVLLEVKRPGYVDPRKSARITVGECLDEWLSTKRAANKAASTLRGYESYIEKRLKPEIGHLRLKDLHPLVIEQMQVRMMEGGRQDLKKGALSPRTRLHAHRILHSAFEWAVSRNYLQVNPCREVEAPSAPHEELQSFTEDQVVSLLAEIRDTPLYVAVLLAVATGCRRGELCGLRWSDIDLDRGQITIRRATDVDKGAIVNYKQPKTHRSRRGVPLPGFALMALQIHKGRQAERRLLLGEAYHAGDHVIAWEDGRPLHPDYVSKRFGKIAGRLGLPTTRFHALRHTCASVLLKLDVHPRIVSEILGHEDIRLTLRTYSHLSPGLAREAMGKLDDAFRRAGGL